MGKKIIMDYGPLSKYRGNGRVINLVTGVRSS